MSRWTDEEIKILKDNYRANASEFLCQALLGRTWAAIQTKACDLKLTRPTAEERFWRKVKKGQNHECWNWLGCYNNSGYGQVRIDRKSILVHRFSWEIHKGKIPDEMCVLHKCDNPFCVNPNHLFLGTNQDNINDKMNKNRQPDLKGEKNGNSKLTLDQVKHIKQLCYEGKFLQKEIAKMFNMSYSLISDINKNKIWRHVNASQGYSSRKDKRCLS